ncbi:MAG: hypothetical protein DRP00_04375 [Candidatus Aenigmatarchaeota archaeon]|nr:MAG: hypothetical protein DRP00_04375 [Candidatus Aenigmarchaeota archaeon]
MDKKRVIVFSFKRRNELLVFELKGLRKEFSKGFKSLVKQADEILKEIREMRAYAERRLEELP